MVKLSLSLALVAALAAALVAPATALSHSPLARVVGAHPSAHSFARRVVVMPAAGAQGGEGAAQPAPAEGRGIDQHLNVVGTDHECCCTDVGGSGIGTVLAASLHRG